MAGRFEITSGDNDPKLGRELARFGFFQSGCHAALIGEPDLHISAPRDIAVETVTSAEQMEEFLAAYIVGWGIPQTAHDQFKRNVRPWLDQPGWSLYLARAEGQAAATATLFIRGGVGYLADSATDPAFRNRGLHSALVRHARRTRVRQVLISFVAERIFSHEPSQYGARWYAAPVPAINLDAARLNAASGSAAETLVRRRSVPRAP